MSEIVTPAEALAADLAPLALAITGHAHLINQHEFAAAEATLEPRLLIGQAIAKAKDIFGLTKAEAGRIGGSMSRRDMLAVDPPELDLATQSMSFQSWLRRETPTLKRTTAIKYEKAFRCLDLPLDCKPTAIREAVKTLRHKAGKKDLTLAAIIRIAAPKEDQSTEIILNDSKTLRLQDAREAFHKWQDAFEKMLSTGMLDDLDKAGIKKLDEFTLGVRDRLKARLK